jgi:hypothetical protein
MFGLFATWVKTEGVVRVVRELSRSSSGATATREYEIDVRTPDGTPLRATVSDPFFAMDFWPPREGDTVGVELDPKSEKVRFDRSDPRLSAKARRAAR